MALTEVLLEEALFWKAKYVHNNPDVGLGPTLQTLLYDILRDLRLGIHIDDSKIIIQNTRERLQKHGIIHF